ncbi:MAG: hypothetical protein ACI89L_001652 [Phycisphaerales bacterium]|jgi:hypothetical protein
MLKICGAMAVAVSAGCAMGQISYGGYTFDDLAFADRAESNDGGTFTFNDAASVDEALTGFTPDSGLYNIGNLTNSNDLTLYFDDLGASDALGADIVLFDLRYSEDAYEIAVITGGVESAFLSYDAASQVNTGESHDVGAATAWAIEIDLASYGVVSAEAIRFRAGLSNVGNVQGDPTMAGVLAVPAPGGLAVVGVVGAMVVRRRRPR